MGRGIAWTCVRAGCQVLLHDTDPVRLHDVVRTLSVDDLAPKAVTSLQQFVAAEIVIETIPEDVALKRRWWTEIEPALSPGAILASNTSSIPISQLAAGLQRPERFCGLHFCHPVECRELVEVVAGAGTASAIVLRAEAFARRIGKLPVPVGDGPGFVLNRLLSLYLTEALELLLEGVELEQLDAAAARLGMPLGPLQQLDQFGLAVAIAVGRTLWQAFPDRWVPSELLVAVYQARRKSGRPDAGFYQCDALTATAGTAAALDPLTRKILSERSRPIGPLSDAELDRRLWLPILIESARILDEGLVRHPDAIDQILCSGLGLLPAFRGLWTPAKEAGEEQLRAWLTPLQPLGGRFVPPASLFTLLGSASTTAAPLTAPRAA